MVPLVADAAATGDCFGFVRRSFHLPGAEAGFERNGLCFSIRGLLFYEIRIFN